MVYKAFKYRLYPNKEQEQLIQKTFGCCRFVYNTTLAYRKNLYETEKKSMSKFDCTKYVTQLKKQEEYVWLKEVDSSALNYSVTDMDTAYQNFFKRHLGYPKFKSKYDRNKSYTTQCTYHKTGAVPSIEIDYEKGLIKLPKLKWTKVVLHRQFEGKIKTATISQTPSGKYFVSVMAETEHEPLAKTGKAVGIDLGIKDMAITSDGKKYDNEKIFKKYEKQLAKLQRQLAHKQKGSANYEKQRLKVARLHEKISNARNYRNHQISSDLVKEYDIICTEDLQVANMLKNPKLAKSISDCGWGSLLTQIDYKCELNDKEHLQVDKFFASSQTCGNCGYKNPEAKNLNVRKWTCPQCGAVHDRDTNAAKNILAECMKNKN